MTILDNIDYNLLYSLYKYRCLTVKQCWMINSPHTDIKTYYRENIIPLIKDKIIKIKISNSKQYALSLDTKGFSMVVEKFRIPSQIVNTETGNVMSEIKSLKDIEVSQRLLSHQLAMNEFVISFQLLFKKIYKDTIEYYDEKFLASLYSTIRPDSMLRIGNIDIFIEQDMSTESSSQLNDKWNKYRRFIEQYEWEYRDRKIVVLFVCSCLPEKLESRKLLVVKTAKNVFLNMLSNSLDIYVGSAKELLNAAFHKILPQHFNSYSFKDKLLTPLIGNLHGFKIANGHKLAVKVGGSLYDYYIRKVDDRNKLVVEDGRVQEFLLDEYYYTPLSVLSKIQYAHRTSQNFKLSYGRNIGYIVLVRNEDELANHLRCTNLFNTENVFFTTPQRLKLLPLNEALFNFDTYGAKYHYQDMGLVSKVYE